jgi:hypothetical protein
MLLISGRKDVMKITVLERALCMKEDGRKEYVIAYLNRHLLDTENRYAFIAKLFLSLYYTCAKFRLYLLSSICVKTCQPTI